MIIFCGVLKYASLCLPTAFDLPAPLPAVFLGFEFPHTGRFPQIIKRACAPLRLSLSRNNRLLPFIQEIYEITLSEKRSLLGVISGGAESPLVWRDRRLHSATTETHGPSSPPCPCCYKASDATVSERSEGVQRRQHTSREEASAPS